MNTNKLILVGILAVMIFGTVYGQRINFKRRTTNEVIRYEHQQHGELIDTVRSFGILKRPLVDKNTTVSTNALLFRRMKDDFNPQLYVWYHYDKTFKKLLGVKYYWGLYNPSFNPRKEQKRLRELLLREKEFKAKYQDLGKELSKLLGKPEGKKTIADNRLRLIEQVYWQDGEKSVSLSIEFSRELVNHGGDLDGNFEIEVMITYK